MYWPVCERGWALTTILTLFTWNLKCLSSFLQATLAKHDPNHAVKILDCQALVLNGLRFWLDGVGFKDRLDSGWPWSQMVWDFGRRVWDLKTFQMVRSVLVSDGLELFCLLFTGRFHKGYVPFLRHFGKLNSTFSGQSPQGCRSIKRSAAEKVRLYAPNFYTTKSFSKVGC